ncbi:exodeoxyribonuclease III [Aureibacillus halotolerans]|uniref:Exodeoxyribonuclease-3 n=1 Tax=Aureibacillus halotolerans TaxID=1508390 RepID=A0A4R6U8G9_9BACI|nr:exodeoxyribonuclease III [Aureibacillus halotolerans]TDQ42681.1 exodeoxyribonuclease-3 [Aureibacillus halotolerans]
MKMISWNVNGLRACVKKGFLDYFAAMDADVFCVQETKMQEGQLELELPGYKQYWNDATRKGYSGTAVFVKEEPMSVQRGLGEQFPDDEGRVITLEYPQFYIVTMYTPNAKRDLSRLSYRLAWEDAARTYLCNLELQKPVLLCGDLNVAHRPIDLKNDRANRGNSGFTDEEREKMTALLEAGFVDSFRYMNGDEDGHYTWWSYMANVRARNIGWRIDYWLVSAQLATNIQTAAIHPETVGSDHCPILLELAF